MITRTVETTKAIVLCLNTESGEACNEVIELPGTYKTGEKLMSAIKSSITNTVVVPVKVVSVDVSTKLLGLEDAKFLELATELDPSTRKPKNN